MLVMVKVIGPGVKSIVHFQFAGVTRGEKSPKVIRNFPSPKNSSVQRPLKQTGEGRTGKNRHVPFDSRMHPYETLPLSSELSSTVEYPSLISLSEGTVEEPPPESPQPARDRAARQPIMVLNKVRFIMLCECVLMTRQGFLRSMQLATLDNISIQHSACRQHEKP